MGEHDLSTYQKAENIAVVSGRVLLETPGSIYDEVMRDLQERPGDVATVAGTSTGLGLGATALLRRCPRAAGIGLAGMLGWQGYQYGRQMLGFMSEASEASDANARDYLVWQGSQALGREGALLTESLPGLLAGGYAANRVMGTPPLYSRFGAALENNVVSPLSNVSRPVISAVQETYAFRGPGSMRLPASTISAEGRVNVLSLSESLAPGHAWTGVETGRTIDLLKLRASRMAKGTANEVSLPFSDRLGRITFHTHAPESAMGARPSLYDIVNTRDLGILHRGSQRTFFVGRAGELDAAIAGGAKNASLDMRAMVLDTESKTAFLLESLWQGKSMGWKPATPRFVDYQQARATLSNLDIAQPWRQLNSLPTLERLPGVSSRPDPLLWARNVEAAPAVNNAANPFIQSLKPRLSDLGSITVLPAASITDLRKSR